MKYRTRLLIAAIIMITAIMVTAGCGGKKTTGHEADKSPIVSAKVNNHNGKKSSSTASVQTPLAGQNKSLTPNLGQSSDQSSDVLAKLFSQKPTAGGSGAIIPGKLGVPQRKLPASIQRPTPKQLLMALRAVYSSMQSLKLAAVTDVVAKRDGKTVENNKGVKSSMLFKRPNMFLLKDKGNVIASDGKSFYNYVVPAKRYIKTKMGRDVMQAMITSKQGVGTVGLLFGVDYIPAASTMKMLKDAKVAGKDTFVLSLKLKSPADSVVNQTLWVGKKDLVIYRNLVVTRVSPKAPKGFKGKIPKLMEITQQGTIVDFEPNVKLPNSTFAYKPPAGVKRAEAPSKAELVEKPMQGLMNKPAPKLSFKLAGGISKSLSDYKGHMVLLSVWALPVCEPLLPVLQNVYKNHKNDVDIVAINLNSDTVKVNKFLQKKGYTFPVVAGNENIAKTLIEKYGIRGLPTTMIIDSNGVVRRVMFGTPPEKDIEAKLAKFKS